MNDIIESLVAAEKECTEQVDIAPEKVLRPIGTKFKDWIESINSTDLPHWSYWVVVAHVQSFRGRRRNALLYERMEEIRLV